MDLPSNIKIDHYLTAAECGPQQEITLSTFTQRVIDAATAHANILGVGYNRLMEHNSAWVLSRLSIDMKRFPSVAENYSFTTWVESVNRHFSERNMKICDESGAPIGYVRTIWVAIDITTRRPADLTPFIGNLKADTIECPIEKTPRLRPIVDKSFNIEHTFRYSDTDFNRHVNTTRYIESILNRWNIEFFDKYRISRFDINYIAEARCDEKVDISYFDVDDNIVDVEITREDTCCTRARITFAER